MGVTVLLDTCALLWALIEPDQLSAKARNVIENTANTLLVSSVSAWEISTKHRLGRLPQAASVVQRYHHHLKTLQTIELPISSEHALLAGKISGEHRDPFDRMLAAQALIEGVSVISNDRAFEIFQVPRLW